MRLIPLTVIVVAVAMSNLSICMRTASFTIEDKLKTEGKQVVIKSGITDPKEQLFALVNAASVRFGVDLDIYMQEIKRYLQGGVPINILDKQGESLLFPAISTGNYALAEFLIKQGIDVNLSKKRVQFPVEGKNYEAIYVPLYYAAKFNDLTGMMKLLINAGAYIEVPAECIQTFKKYAIAVHVVGVYYEMFMEQKKDSAACLQSMRANLGPVRVAEEKPKITVVKGKIVREDEKRA